MLFSFSTFSPYKLSATNIYFLFFSESCQLTNLNLYLQIKGRRNQLQVLGLPKLNCTGSFDWTYKFVWLVFQDHKTSKLTSIINIWCFWIMNSFFFASAPVFNQNLQFLQTFRWQICFLEHSWDVNVGEMSTGCLNAIQASKKYHQPLFPLFPP